MFRDGWLNEPQILQRQDGMRVHAGSIRMRLKELQIHKYNLVAVASPLLQHRLAQAASVLLNLPVICLHCMANPLSGYDLKLKVCVHRFNHKGLN